MDYYDAGLCIGLAAAGVDTILHTSDDRVISSLSAGFSAKQSFAGIYGNAPVWKRGLRFVLASVFAIFSAVWQGRRICHFHFFFIGPLQLFQVCLARLLCRRVVITAHDVESFVDWLEKPVLRRMAYTLAHRIIAHNRVSHDELINRIGLAAEKIAVIPHGNYLQSLRPLPDQAEARQRLGIDTSARVILFFGQIKDVKGLDLLIQAMPAVLEQYPDAVLLIAGKPWKSGFSRYQLMIDQLGINSQCLTDIRYIPDDEVATFYAAADLVVLPYRRIYQSGVVLMAMSYGKPVLVSDLPGMTEIVSDNINGLVFRQNDSQALASALCHALADPARLSCLADSAFAHVRDHYDWQRIGKLTADLYASIY
ncbi:MAG TPA: glycosyltransferase family 4 protein [Pseudomonadales bacterium]